MTIDLAGGASTQSRGRRPLPPDVTSAITAATNGAYEHVRFMRDGLEAYTRKCLSWVMGQSGILWGGGPFPFTWRDDEVPGAYGHAAEYRLADALGAVYDGLLTSNEMSVRFFQNGGDSCAAAARVCRAVTGRNQIMSYGYHGAHADFAHAPMLVGVPSGQQALHINFQDWREFWPDNRMAGYYRYAAIVLEVPPAEDDEMREWLQSWREYCDRTDMPLVIDDVVLGFRIALGGSAEYYGVKPDIVILGKAMSATGCVSAVLGRKDLVGRLGEDVFYSCTFAGSPGPVSIASSTVKWLTENKNSVYGRDGHLRKIGVLLKDGLNEVFKKKEIDAEVMGQPERSILSFSGGDELRRLWCSKMIERGFIFDRPQFSTLVHTTQDVENSLKAAYDVVV